MQLGRLGRLDAGQRRAGLAEALEQLLRLGHVALGRRGQGGGLQEGQQLDEIVRAEGPLRGRQRPVLADDLGRRGEELHAVQAQAGVGGGRQGVVEADEPGRPVVVEHHVAHPRVAVGDAPSCSRPRFAQASSRTASVTALGLDVGEALAGRVADDEEGVVAPARRARRRRPRGAGRRCGRRGTGRRPGARPGARGSATASGRSPCTRRTARAWRTGGRRCCRARRPGSRARRPSRR